MTRQSTLDRAAEQALEWDLGLGLNYEAYRDDAARIVQLIEKLYANLDSGLTYGLVGGIEFVAPLPTEAGRLKQQQKAGHTVSKYHVHVALIFNKMLSQRDVLALLCRTTDPERNYCQPRDPAQPYLGWYWHHTKLITKIGTERVLTELGYLPEDDMTDRELLEGLRWRGYKFGYAGAVLDINQRIKTIDAAKLQKELDQQNTEIQQERKLVRKTYDAKRKREYKDHHDPEVQAARNAKAQKRYISYINALKTTPEDKQARIRHTLRNIKRDYPSVQ